MTVSDANQAKGEAVIELRWVWGTEPAPEFGEGFSRQVRVLQYRSGSYPYQSPHDKEWVGTDWQDVPTVTDPT